MTTSRTRLLAIAGATLALVVAATGVVTAHPGGRGGDRDGGFGDRLERRGFGGPGGIRGGARLGDAADGFISRETIITTDDGIVTQKVENGSVTAVSDSAIEIELATGESMSVAIDDETNATALAESEATNEGRRGFRGPRLRPTEIAVTDIAVGSDVVVWSRSGDDGSFVAQRIMVQPDLEAAAAATGDLDAGDAGTADAALPLDLDTQSL